MNGLMEHSGRDAKGLALLRLSAKGRSEAEPAAARYT
jgi:hypothetical protein